MFYPITTKIPELRTLFPNICRYLSQEDRDRAAMEACALAFRPQIAPALVAAPALQRSPEQKETFKKEKSIYQPIMSKISKEIALKFYNGLSVNFPAEDFEKIHQTVEKVIYQACKSGLLFWYPGKDYETFAQDIRDEVSTEAFQQKIEEACDPIVKERLLVLEKDCWEMHPYNLGALGRKAAEALLKNEGEWLIRFSESYGKMVISRRVDDKFIHLEATNKPCEIEDQLSLEKLIKDAPSIMISELGLWKSVAQHPYNAGPLAEETVLRLLKHSRMGAWILYYNEDKKVMMVSQKVEKGIANFPITAEFHDWSIQDIKARFSQEMRYVPKYDRQFHFNLGSGNTAKGLMHKAKKSALFSRTIDLRKNSEGVADIQENLKTLKELTLRSRIYLIGHCKKGEDFIRSDMNFLGIEDQITAQEFAQMLATHAPQLIRTDSPPCKLRISVVACFAAVALPNQKSFIEVLQKALDDVGIPAEIFGRTDIVNRATDVGEGFQKKVMGRHHVTGDKLVIETGQAAAVVLYPEKHQDYI